MSTWTRSASGTSDRSPSAWIGSCANDPEAWDLDVIGNNLDAIRRAVTICRACPALAQCNADTDAIAKTRRRPQAQIRAGRIFRTTTNGAPR